MMLATMPDCIKTRRARSLFLWIFALLTLGISGCASPAVVQRVTPTPDLGPLTPAVYAITFASTQGNTIAQNTLYALDAATGTLRWQLAPTNVIATPPMIAHGVVIVATNDPTATASPLLMGTITAYDARTGATRWSLHLARIVQMTTDGQSVFVGQDSTAVSPPATTENTPTPTTRATLSFTLTALNATTGDVVWTFTTTRAALGMPPVLIGNMIAIAVTSVISTLNPIPTSTLLVFDARTGKLRWQRHLNALIVGLTARGTTLYLTGDDQLAQPGTQPGAFALALRANDGHTLWDFPVTASVSAPTADTTALYIGVLNGATSTIIALDLHTGTVLWQTSADALVAGIGTSSFAVWDHRLFASMGAPGKPSVLALSAVDGSLLWQRADTFTPNAPVVFDTNLYLSFNPPTQDAASLSRIEALDASDGLLNWRMQVPGTIAFPLTVG